MRPTLSVGAAKALRVAAMACVASAVSCAPALAATDGPYPDVYYVNSCDTSSAASPNPAPIFSASTFGVGMTTGEACGGLGAGLQINASQGASRFSSAKWVAETPSPSIRIVGVSSQGLADCNLGRDGFAASYFYGDNGVNYGAPPITIDCHGASGINSAAGGLDQKIQSSRYLGWDASCQPSSCTPTGAGGLVFTVTGITLEAQETTGPALLAAGASNLYYQTGWVRGTFPANLQASDPSGVCAMQTTVNGPAVNSYRDPSPDTSTWSQCPGSSLPANVDTTTYANGPGTIDLSYAASNAAGAASSASKAINVDNVTPTVTLTGSADAPSTEGTQYVTATATAGRSGIGAISCSTDAGPEQTYPGPNAQVPVSGIGSHTVSCYAQNRAVNAAGQPALSATANFSLSIRQPTAAAISFDRIADKLRCHKVTVKVRVPGRLRVIMRHGHRIRVRGRSRLVKRRVRRCHARTVRRRVVVIKKRHGKRVKVVTIRRVVLLPHAVAKAKRRVGHGKPTTVSGYLGLADGTPLSGRVVQVLAAPNNGLGQFTPMATVTTNADGGWTAKVPAGPSRLIEAIYGGDQTTEPAGSTIVKLSVPALIKLKIAPHVIPWRAKIKIRGRLVGGYVPADGVALRLLVRYPHSKQRTPLQALRTDAAGRFAFTWSYHAGRGVATYPLAIATTATESDYPFAAASSRPVRVTFGKPTPNALGASTNGHRATHHRHHGRRQHRRHHRHRRSA